MMCPHNVDLTQYNCETCAEAHATQQPEEKGPFPANPTFVVYHDGDQWICELDCYRGHGKTVGRSIDTAVTVALGMGRGKSVKAWIDNHRYEITGLELESEEEEGRS